MRVKGADCGLSLRSYEVIESCDRRQAIDGYLVARRTSPADSERIAALAEESLDVLRLVAECVPRRSPNVGALALGRDDSGAVAMNQPSDEWFAGGGDDRVLPRLQRDRSQVLPARSMLRDEARPVLRPHRYVDASTAGAGRGVCAIVWKHCAQSRTAVFDDCWIGGIKSDTHPPDAAAPPRYAAISEVEAQ